MNKIFKILFFEGYFPPFVVCPKALKTIKSFPLVPEKEARSTGCYAESEKAIGHWVNGVAIYSPMSGSSFSGQNIWHYVKPVLDKYDVV